MSDYTSSLTFSAPGTAEAILAGTKTVTRRLKKSGRPRWRVGALTRAYRKAPYLGGKPFAELEIVSVRAERLGDITPEEVEREGFSEWTPTQFLALFFSLHPGARLDTDVWRVEFRLVPTSADAIARIGASLLAPPDAEHPLVDGYAREADEWLRDMGAD